MASGCEAASETKVRFANPSNESLAAVLHDAGPGAPAVGLAHGYTDSKDGFHFPRLARELQAAGLTALRFDFAGNGESEGAFDFCAHAKEVEDIRAAVSYLRGRGLRVAALVGHSKGAAEVLLYSAKYDDVPQVVSISARFDMTTGITQRFGANVMERVRSTGPIEMRTRAGIQWKLTLASLEERVGTDMATAAGKIRESRVMTVHGDADETIPVADAYEYDRRIQGHVLHVVPGANHNYTQQEAAAELLRLVLGWLAPAASPPA